MGAYLQEVYFSLILIICFRYWNNLLPVILYFSKDAFMVGGVIFEGFKKENIQREFYQHIK